MDKLYRLASAFRLSKLTASRSAAPQKKILAVSCSEPLDKQGLRLGQNFESQFSSVSLCLTAEKNLIPMPQTELETRSPKVETDLRELAQDAVRRAMAGGATAAEAVVREGDEFSTTVRLGQVETLKESGSRAIGVRVFFGKRAASTYSSDFSRSGLDRMLNSALALAKITSEDPFGGIPEAAQLGSLSGDLDLYHEDVYSLPGVDRIEYARRAE